MKAEFNPDGSIKLPKINPDLAAEEEKEFNEEKTVRFVRRPISDSPLIDELDILVSVKIENADRIEQLFRAATGLFRHMAQLTITQINPRRYVVRIVSGQYRDTWIHNFMNFIKQEMNVKIQYWGGIHDFRKGRRFSGPHS